MGEDTRAQRGGEAPLQSGSAPHAVSEPQRSGAGMHVEDVPPQRVAPLREVILGMRNARRVVLTTHVNADGDGTGSQAAVAGWLAGLGIGVTVVNPTPFPTAFRFLFEDGGIIADAGSVAGEAALRDADLIVVLDTAEPSRIGRVAKRIAGRTALIIDHHVRGTEIIDGIELMDATACATGELIYDLLLTDRTPRPWPQQVLEGLYTAIVTDTGSFRFSNTTRRAHAIAGDLIEQGVDPELMYRRIYGTVPLRRIELLRYALDRLEVDEECPITSISIERGVMEKLDATSEDLDGIIDHARSIEGTEVAILFRETADGSTKVSLRSAGTTDVNAVARQFGGGGHVKASGALLSERLETARPRVLAAVRAALLASTATAAPGSAEGVRDRR
jgi:bifunctional oligoribonuclease and PAP phosphatase NrnA